jgi:hypothetical protein
MNFTLMAAVALLATTQIAGSLRNPPGISAGAGVNGGGARIEFSATSFDFGRVKASDLLRHEFIVTNTGSEVLEVSQVEPACDCTVAGDWDHRIPPGGKGRIPIEFHPARFNGPVTKAITVTCNDAAEPVHSLQIRADAWQPVEVHPEFVHFTPVGDEAGHEVKIVRIVSKLGEPLMLEQPQSSNPAFAVETKVIRAGREFELRVKYVGGAGSSNPRGAITIKTSSADVPLIKIGTGANVQEAFTLMPPRITLPSGPLKPGYQHVQMIRNNTGTPIQLRDASLNAEGASVRIAETQPGKMFALYLNFPKDYQLHGDGAVQLTVRTSHPRHGVITAAITQAPPGPFGISPVAGGARVGLK